MNHSLATIEAEAEALVKAHSVQSSATGSASTSMMGAAGRKRAGSGEPFWQYRPYSPEDSASRIDWRKSARSNEHFVRDTEQETPHNFMFWTDPNPGFRWSSNDDYPTKFARGLVLELAIAKFLSGSGDKVGALQDSRPAKLGKKAPLQMADTIFRANAGETLPKSTHRYANYILASDFYGDWNSIENGIKQLVQPENLGSVMMICDHSEANFPYEGRVEFQNPNTQEKLLLGQAQELRAAYIEKFEERKKQLENLVDSLGWNFHFHLTSEASLPIFAEVLQKLEARK